MVLCDECTVVGKTRQIWCEITGNPCLHVRYCAVSMKYYQTDAAAKCKVRKQNGAEDNEAG